MCATNGLMEYICLAVEWTWMLLDFLVVELDEFLLNGHDGQCTHMQLALWIRKASRASLVRQAISSVCGCGHTDNSHACNVSR
jgi:hypothetical protein